MKAELIFRDKQRLPDGSILEMVIWQTPERSAERPHGIKYRCYYGTADGICLVRYDNERGKGDHKHLGEVEMPYRFVDPETLVADFLADVQRARGGKR